MTHQPTRAQFARSISLRIWALSRLHTCIEFICISRLERDMRRNSIDEIVLFQLLRPILMWRKILFRSKLRRRDTHTSARADSEVYDAYSATKTIEQERWKKNSLFVRIGSTPFVHTYCQSKFNVSMQHSRRTDTQKWIKRHRWIHEYGVSMLGKNCLFFVVVVSFSMVRPSPPCNKQHSVTLMLWNRAWNVRAVTNCNCIGKHTDNLTKTEKNYDDDNVDVK